MAENLGHNDPYRNMKRSDIRPGFLGGKSGERDGRHDNAAEDLKGAEENAAGSMGGGDGEGAGGASRMGLPGVAAGEKNAGGVFTGVGKAKDDKKGGKAKGFLKRKGPIALILGLILGVGGMVGGAQMLMPFSLVAQFTETFNSMHVATKTRSAAFFRYQMDTGRVKDPIKGKIFGDDTFKITNKQANKLAAQGITYDSDYDGNGTRVLKFDDGSGNIKIVTADADVAKKLGNGAVDFNTIYKDNPDFYNGYNKGSMTWRGAIANWFDTITVKFLQSNKITRNLFKDFQEEVKARKDGNTKAAALELMAKGTDEITEGGYKVHGEQEEYEYEDENGEPKTDWRDVDNGNVEPGVKNGDVEVDNDDGSFRIKGTDSEGKLGPGEVVGGGKTSRSEISTTEGVRSKLNSIAGSVQKGANIACTVFNVIGGVSLLVTASEALQIINLATSYFEAIDKVKAGDGNDSPINDLANALTEDKTNSHTVITSSKVWDDSNQDSNFTDGKLNTISDETSSTNKSAMESSGITSLYSGNSVDINDPSVKSFNFTSSINRILGGVGTSVSMFEACAIAKIAANATSAITDALQIAACVLGVVGAAFTFGLSTTACSGLVMGMVKGIALGVAIGVTVAGVISAITPTISSMLTRDLISDIGGEDLGNALTSGANMYMGKTHRSNGGSLTNVENYTAYMVEKQSVIADDAKYERQNKSPFDASSKYTFLGVLMDKTMGLLSNSSVIGAIKTTSSVVSSSVASLSPTVMAYDISKTLPTEDEYKETCPYLWSIGAVGDAYCNPYVITDISTINMDPSDVIDKVNDIHVSEEPNLLDDESNGNVKINPKSDLAKYINYCDNRNSAFGIVDNNIASQVSDWGNVQTSSSLINNASNSAIGAIPVIGDVIDVVNSEQQLANVGYISGESCVAGNTVNKSESPDWEEAKYYQRFIEDQSLAETIGLVEKSAVTAYLDEYYEQNPLDNSYEGILARYSGLTKDNVVALLDFIDYGNYIAEYDVSERYAFGAPIVEKDDSIQFESENLMAGAYILFDNIIYADVRNRTNLV